MPKHTKYRLRTICSKHSTCADGLCCVVAVLLFCVLGSRWARRLVNYRFTLMLLFCVLGLRWARRLVIYRFTCNICDNFYRFYFHLTLLKFAKATCGKILISDELISLCLLFWAFAILWVQILRAAYSNILILRFMSNQKLRFEIFLYQLNIGSEWT